MVVDVMVPTRLTGEQRELSRFEAVSGRIPTAAAGLLLRPSQGSIQVGAGITRTPITRIFVDSTLEAATL